MTMPDYTIANLPCARCGCDTEHFVDLEFTRPVGRSNFVEIGEAVPLIKQPSPTRSFVITPSLAFGLAQCQTCYAGSYAIVELRGGRLRSVRYWGLELPEGVFVIDDFDDEV
ncbi:MAG: hypothetical protein JNK05_20535 [Myxococcales bacterium]|nr:hypothetical protein [Myxococcales bacterium]